MRRVKEIINEMEKFAPIYLKEDFDNVGLMVGDKEQKVEKVLLALDCTLKVIEEAKENNVDLIITHHPLIFRKPSSITTDSLQGKKIIELIKNDIALYSSHTNLDSVNEGINHTITKLLGFDNSKILEVNKRDSTAGIGRIAKVDKDITLEQLVTLVKEKLNIQSLRVVKGNEKISKVAIINGSGQDYIGKAVGKGANCIITGDTTYHFASDYKEMGVSIIDVGHFASEWITFLMSIEVVKKQLKDIEFIVSKVVEDPYDFY